MLRSQVKESKCFGLDENKKVGTFSKQVEYWMDYIIPGPQAGKDKVQVLKVSQRNETTGQDLFLSPKKGYIGREGHCKAYRKAFVRSETLWHRGRLLYTRRDI
jgi:hypothetical protein|nr:hypothetical protein [uncultured Acetatifactor sp.]